MPINRTKSCKEMTEKTTILFLIGNFGVGGKERQMIELIHGLPQDRFSCHLFVKNHDAFYLTKVQDRLGSFYSLENDNFHPFDFLCLARQIDRIKPDIVCSWANVTSHFSLLARLFTKHRYRLINCCIRNAPIQLSAVLKFERLMYSFYSCVVANSNAGLSAYGQNGKKGRYVLYNGFDIGRIPLLSKEAARKKLTFAAEQFIVVMVAGLTVLKDHKTILRAAAACEKQSENIQFLIVGDGTERSSLENWVHENELASTVSFLGKRDDVELIFRAADLSVLTSTSWFGEGTSNSIIESMACGTPVIASDSPGTREVIKNGENGFLVECGDHQALAEKIIELQRAPETIVKLSIEARKRIEKKFSIDQLIGNFCQIIEKCSD